MVFTDNPLQNDNPYLQSHILKHMMHGPYGPLNVKVIACQKGSLHKQLPQRLL